MHPANSAPGSEDNVEKTGYVARLGHKVLPCSLYGLRDGPSALLADIMYTSSPLGTTTSEAGTTPRGCRFGAQSPRSPSQNCNPFLPCGPVLYGMNHTIHNCQQDSDVVLRFRGVGIRIHRVYPLPQASTGSTASILRMDPPLTGKAS